MIGRGTALGWSARSLIVGLAAGLALLGTAGAASGSATPSISGADIEVTIQGDGTADVRAVYELVEPASEELRIEHRVLPREGSRLLDISGGEGIEEVDESTYAVTVPEGASEYAVTTRSTETRPGDVVLPVPDIPTAEGADVDIEVVLPDGAGPTGDLMPTFTTEETERGAVLTHSGIAVPSAIVAPYGTSQDITLGDTLTVLGLGVMLVTAVIWIVHGAGGFRRGGARGKKRNAS